MTKHLWTVKAEHREAYRPRVCLCSPSVLVLLILSTATWFEVAEATENVKPKAPSAKTWAHAYVTTRSHDVVAAAELPGLAHDLDQLRADKMNSSAINSTLQLLKRHLAGFAARIQQSAAYSETEKVSVLKDIHAVEAAATTTSTERTSSLVLPPGSEGAAIPRSSSLHISNAMCQKYVQGYYRYLKQFEGRPAYESEDGVYFLYYSANSFRWMLSNDLGAQNGYAYTKSDDPREPSGWKEYCNDTWADSTLAIQNSAYRSDSSIRPFLRDEAQKAPHLHNYLPGKCVGNLCNLKSGDKDDQGYLINGGSWAQPDCRLDKSGRQICYFHSREMLAAARRQQALEREAAKHVGTQSNYGHYHATATAGPSTQHTGTAIFSTLMMTALWFVLAFGAVLTLSAVMTSR